MSAVHEMLEQKINSLYDQLRFIDQYYYPGCGMPVTKEMAEIIASIEELEYQLRYTCKCGKPAEDMYDDYGIYAGKYCSEECCPINLHWSNDGSECLEEDY